MKDFGVVILTYPGDYHLAEVLIKSLEFFNPGIQIAIIPGTGFNEKNHPFERHELVRPPDKIREAYSDYYDRKFWAFFSPFSTFLYLDADIICLKKIDLEGLLKKTASDRFLLANLPNPFYGLLEDNRDDRFEKVNNRLQLGILENIIKFNADYDYYKNYLINSGLFVANTHTFSESDLVEFRDKEKMFYQNVLKTSYKANSLYDLFYGDQGRLNYLIYYHKVRLDSVYPEAHYQWGGMPFNYSLHQIFSNECDIPFIHWAGSLKPSYSIFCKGIGFRILINKNKNFGYTYLEQKSVPGLELWEYFDNRKTLKSILNDSFKDFKKYIWPRIKGSIKKKLWFRS